MQLEMTELNSYDLEEEAFYDDKFNILRDRLCKVNETNIIECESIDCLYITYVSLLNNKHDLELNKNYKILSDKIISISKLLNEIPFSISKYLGFTFIMSIWILKSRDWYNLNDLSNIDICNTIINLIIEYCKRSMDIYYLNEDDGYIIDEKLINDENLSFEIEEDLFIHRKKRYKKLDYSINKKRKLYDIFNNEYDKELKYIIFEITRRNIETICSLINKELVDNFFNIVQKFEFDENKRDLIFNKLYFLNSMICFYRCSGSFLNIALMFKLPRGRYLLEKGLDVISNYVFNEMIKIYNNISKTEDEINNIIIQIIEDISIILWFKIFEMKISIIVDSTLYQSINETFEENKINQEYLKLEFLNRYSDLINIIINHYIDYNRKIFNHDNSLMNLSNKIKNNQMKIILEIIYKIFNVPFIYRNYFMTHFHVTKINNHQILNLLFNIGYMTRLSIKNIFNKEIIGQILKTYSSTIYLISRFGNSSTKELFTYQLINGLNYHFFTQFDIIYENIKSFLFYFDQKIESTEKCYIFILFKFSYNIIVEIKNSLINYDENYITNIINNKEGISISLKNYFMINNLIYYKITSLIYTLNFINILLNSENDKQISNYKELYLFIEKVIFRKLTKNELNQIISIINNEFYIYKFEKRAINQNLVFEINFIKSYISKSLSIPIIFGKNLNLS